MKGRPRTDGGEAIFTRVAWKVVAQGGGWWTSAEIIKEIPFGISTINACSMLGRMAGRGCFERRGSRGNYEYAVSPDCIVPRGLTASEVVHAVTGDAV